MTEAWHLLKKDKKTLFSLPTFPLIIKLQPSKFSGHCITHLKVLVFQPCLTLCNPMDDSLPDSSVHGILQARIQEWVAIPSSRGSSQPTDWPRVSWTGRQILYCKPHKHSILTNHFLPIYHFALAEFFPVLRHKGLWYRSSSEPLKWHQSVSTVHTYSIPWWVKCLPLNLPTGVPSCYVYHPNMPQCWFPLQFFFQVEPKLIWKFVKQS